MNMELSFYVQSKITSLSEERSSDMEDCFYMNSFYVYSYNYTFVL